MTTILLTGFGPFPGAPFNPTEPLIKRLVRVRRPAFAGANIVSHIFATSYAAVDRELPSLLRDHNPDVLLMFGLAGQTRHLRVETLARNTLAGLPDAQGVAPAMHAIAPEQISTRTLPVPARRLVAAARAARVPVALSRDAGQYLCNYLCWRAAHAAGAPNGPRIAAFVHVPMIRRGPIPRARIRRRLLNLDDLVRAGGALLAAVAAASH